jgi:hypothetical protein
MGNRKRQVVRKRTSFSTKDRFKAVIISTIQVEQRISDQQPSSTLTGVNSAVEALLDIHNSNLKEFAEEVQLMIPIAKQGVLEKLLKFYLQ